MNASNHSIQPTGASRSGQCQFLHQRRLAPAADSERHFERHDRHHTKDQT